MAQAEVLEGTRDELQEFLKRQPEQQRFRLIPLHAEEGKTDEAQHGIELSVSNEQGLAVMRQIAERHNTRRTTDNSNTTRLLREARAGAAYGYEPTE